MSAIDRIKESITYAIMQRNGWTEESKETNPLDWDPKRDDSQVSMIKEDVDFIVNAFLGHLEDEGIEDEEEEEEEEETNTTSAAFFIFMDAGVGNPRYVSDVREWLETVDRLGVPDDTEIEGTLHLSYDLRDNPFFERIECGGCGQKDVLITIHSCEETPC